MARKYCCDPLMCFVGPLSFYAAILATALCFQSPDPETDRIDKLEEQLNDVAIIIADNVDEKE